MTKRKLAMAFTSCFVTLTALAPERAFAQPNLAVARSVGSPSSSREGGLEDTSIVGRWVWTLDVGRKFGKVTMDVSQNGGKLAAVLVTPEGEKIKPKEFVVKDGKVKLVIEKKRGLFTFKMRHEGKLSGNAIRGEFSASGGPIKKSGKWMASRVKKNQE